MKILSQCKKMISVLENNKCCGIYPYCEKRGKYCDAGSDLKFCNCYLIETELSLGKYSTLEKAQVVLQMIFESKSDRFIMPQDEEVDI